jgi:phosphate-selective porin OprO and OprP
VTNCCATILVRFARIGALVLLLFVNTALCQDTDPTAEERIRRLEKQLESINEALTSLKAQVAATQAQAASADATKRAVDQLSSEVAETSDKASTGESQLNQIGVRAYLGPGLVFEDPRGRWRVQLSARAQADFRAFSPDSADANTFSVRRARIGFSGTLLDYYGVFVEEEFANQNTNPSTSTSTPILTFAYADFNWFKSARIRAGQFKPFIGLDNSMLDLQTDFMERALTQSLFQNLTYDRGVMVFGEPGPLGLFYSTAVTNGTGQAVDEQQGNLQEAEADGKDYTLRIVENFAKAFELNDTVIHFGAAYKRGSAVNSATNPYRAPTVQTEARGLTFFIPAPFNSSGSTASISNINRTIVDLEAALAWKAYKIQGDYVQARYSGSSESPGAPLDFSRSLKAAYITLGWMITGENYADFYREGTFGRPRPRNNFYPGQPGSWGLWELNLRYSWFDGSDFNNSNPVNTGRVGTSANFPNITASTNKAKAWTIGLKWQPIQYARFVMNLMHTRFDTPVTVNGKDIDNENAITVRAQVDF